MEGKPPNLLDFSGPSAVFTGSVEFCDAGRGVAW